MKIQSLHKLVDISLKMYYNQYTLVQVTKKEKSYEFKIFERAS